MKDLLTYIAKSLVETPDAVNVTEVQKEDGLVLELRVASEDMGKVIGKHGRIAKEIRTVIKAASLRENIKVSVDIVD
ncbi:MAG: KH domain-containing protein [Oscillospiraceae bacterium]|nr:KH domain-containing protein [Oscillospiraceae bacterium]